MNRFTANKPVWPFVLNKDCDLAEALVFYAPMSPPVGPLTVGQKVFEFVKSNHLALTGALKPAPGFGGTGSSMRWVNTADFLGVTATPVTAMPLSMACWYNVTQVGTTQCLMSMSLPGSDGMHYDMDISAGAGIIAEMKNTSAVSAATSTNAAALTWQHAAAVYTSTTLRAAFLNGGGKGTNTTSETLPVPTATSIGLLRRSSNIFPFAGQMEECCMWSRALTDSEVRSLYDPKTRWQLRYQPGRTKWFLGAGTTTNHALLLRRRRMACLS